MRIVNPCPDGSAIRTVDGTLHCSRCESDVLDLREVTERRAHALVAEARRLSPRVCVRMYRDVHGTPSFLREPERPRRRLPMAEVALVATLAAGCAGADPATTEQGATTQPTEGGEACATDDGAGTGRATGAGAGTDAPAGATTSPGPTPSGASGAHGRPHTDAPRTVPADVMVDGGLG